MASQAKTDLHASLEALGKRIEEHRHHSTTESGVPYGASKWSDIVATHGRLVREFADDRDHDASAIERLRADVKALSLSLDDWLKNIDRHFAAKGSSGA